jgi:protein ImuA
MARPQEVLRRLRHRIEKLEARPPLMQMGGARLQERPWAAAKGGLMHEVWTPHPRDAGAGLGFALGLVRPLLTEKRPVMLWLQTHHEALETGIVYGAGLAACGIDPAAVIIGRLKSVAELLWCAEEALSARGVAAVLADIEAYPKALDFTATRRLSLRAHATGASMLLIRHGEEHPASAAQLRWCVTPAPSGLRAFDPRAPGPPRFAVTLDRAAQGLRGNWLLEWTHDGFGEIGREERARQTASGAMVPLLGDRLSRSA